MTVEEKVHPSEDSAWPITINDIHIKHLSSVVDQLCNDALDTQLPRDIERLKIVRDQISQVVETEYVQLFGKIQAVLFFIDEDVPSSETIIIYGIYNEKHHEFLQKLYRKILVKKGVIPHAPPHLVKKQRAGEDFCAFPRSIDPILEDGLPKSVCEYLDKYHLAKQASRKALNVKELSMKTGLSEGIIELRFQKHREQKLQARRPLVKKEEPEETEDDTAQYHQQAHYYEPPQYWHGNVMFDCYPSPPVETCHRFPLTRVPLDQPLTIEIPQEFPCYFPNY
ncbi:hypothetical protein L5515_007357 [Caenorhabditis briggsae]|uniref:Uncharacterized protein n=1 Tax=Caenorhabditis briggsae TaxID=6238 RepID=A0AAE9F2Y0_CAEBR|nr:hypothetical protein L5515_007357 [Caenorhabditis briggsae]